MSLPAYLFRRWMKMGLYARLFVPITVLIVTIVSLRYTLLVESESAQARHQFALESQQTLSRLLQQARIAIDVNDAALLSAQLQGALTESHALTTVTWSAAGHATRVQQAGTQPAYPNWFPRMASIAPIDYVVPVQAAGELHAAFSPTPALNAAWRALRKQVLVTLLNIFLIYSLLGLMIHVTRRMMRHVVAATRAFRDGDLSVRLPVRGFPEVRELATTFNGMAARIQELMGSLHAEKERIEVTLASIGDAVIATGPGGLVLTMNRTAERLTGFTAAEAQGRALHGVFTLANNFGQHTLLKTLSAIEAGGPVVTARDQSLRNRRGERYTVEYTAAPIRHEDTPAEQASPGIVLVFRDVSERRHLMQQMSWQSHHDVLTGLPNRTALEPRFEHEIARARDEQVLLAVCLFDLDHFRLVNDSGGQGLGDEVLKQAASRLHDFAGAHHYVARLGGDEFVLLLRDQASRADVERALERLMQSLARVYHAGGRAIPLTASAGVALCTGAELSADHLLRHADQALYQAKMQGRSKVHFFDAAADEQVRTHHNRRTEVREALLADQLRLFYQPKVNLRDGRVVGMEALLRWQHPARGLLAPLEFLPAIEHTDLIADIGEWVLRRALAQVEQWCAAGREWAVSVNIAARHFQRPDFVRQLRAILDEFPGVPPRLLQLEILESSALHDVAHVRAIMQECQAFGIRFALDDFGTGYSSMSYLKRLPADVLKIDQGFVRNMLEDRDDLHLVSAVIGLARAFNRGVIAEGVETVAHGELLIRLGCDLAQGYGIARPMPPDDVPAWADGFVAAPEWISASLQEPLAAPWSETALARLPQFVGS
ncbi:PAS domain S-box-containing protein/diguanylate cyclase (GGDEF)-like protein [Pseudoduganella lurida]|uniref:PAS domain S-box-containing protein/diguanylate cyclase (GGDEF)-like protein n=1 Tax=Pseudoduganella lurida TaxID=1036180 RepID=A0A562R5D9_9BURK|nr:EAL domain-containing protein [Pseudoduganella lurida]TWI63596.1 PAS domain S-box-containing protein/diguanylate cyclase (GGDEF)-like protein [Pseudoduganella lurida]